MMKSYIFIISNIFLLFLSFVSGYFLSNKISEKHNFDLLLKNTSLEVSMEIDVINLLNESKYEEAKNYVEAMLNVSVQAYQHLSSEKKYKLEAADKTVRERYIQTIKMARQYTSKFATPEIRKDNKVD